MEGFGRVISNEAGNGQYEVYVKNHLGSAVKVHNTFLNQTVYMTDYEPYGKARFEQASGANSVSLTHKFTGKERDEVSSLDYFGARYYDSDIGLWISPDAARQYHSPYTYCGNSPIGCVDKDGNFGAAASIQNGKVVPSYDATSPPLQNLTRQGLLEGREALGNAGTAALVAGVAVPILSVGTVPFEGATDLVNIGIDITLWGMAFTSGDKSGMKEAGVLLAQDGLSLAVGVPIARIADKVRGGVKGLGNVGGKAVGGGLEAAKDLGLEQANKPYNERHRIGE
jgi:RHS repeat-associated protein